MYSILEKAQNKQNELSVLLGTETIQNQRPLFHFATPGGWCNDPNGFSQFNNTVHLFYQYHPYSTQWGPMHWGHVTSDDMLSWKLQPVALAPDSAADNKGCFSGTALEHEGKHILAYTGVSNNGKADIQNQCIAIGDGTTYTKLETNPVITASNIPFDFKITDFRDPKIWKKDGMFYMVCVLKQMNDCGAMVMLESSDARNWKWKGILDYSKDGLSKMWECPDIFTVDGKDLLIFSPQEVKESQSFGFHNGNNSVYVSGKLDYENCKFLRETRPENDYTAALVDYGIDFYAPETTKLKDGRTIMIGWMQAWESYITPADYLWSGMMTIPRELTFKNNRLYQLPVRELENWKTRKDSPFITNGSEKTVYSSARRHFEIDFSLKNSSGKIQFILGTSEEYVLLEINMDSKTIFFDRSKSLTPGAIPSRMESIRTDKKDFDVKILCDTCSLEVFIDNGIMAFTNTFFLTKPESDLKVLNHTSENLKFDVWEIRKPV